MPAIKITGSMRQQRLLKSARAKKGLTQAKVAKKLGITQGAYGLIEENIENAKLGRVLDICKILSLDIADIIQAGKEC